MGAAGSNSSCWPSRDAHVPGEFHTAICIPGRPEEGVPVVRAWVMAVIILDAAVAEAAGYQDAVGPSEAVAEPHF
jgi:hypothetical protein